MPVSKLSILPARFNKLDLFFYALKCVGKQLVCPHLKQKDNHNIINRGRMFCKNTHIQFSEYNMLPSFIFPIQPKCGGHLLISLYS